MECEKTLENSFNAARLWLVVGDPSVFDFPSQCEKIVILCDQHPLLFACKNEMLFIAPSHVICFRCCHCHDFSGA